MVVKSSTDCTVRSRELLDGFSTLKNAILSTALVLGNRSIPLFLPIYIYAILQNRQPPQDFALREQVQNPIVSTYLSVKAKLYIECPVPPVRYMVSVSNGRFSIFSVHFFIFLVPAVWLIGYRHLYFSCTKQRLDIFFRKVSSTGQSHKFLHFFPPTRNRAKLN